VLLNIKKLEFENLDIVMNLNSVYNMKKINKKNKNKKYINEKIMFIYKHNFIILCTLKNWEIFKICFKN